MASGFGMYSGEFSFSLSTIHEELMLTTAVSLSSVELFLFGTLFVLSFPGVSVGKLTRVISMVTGGVGSSSSSSTSSFLLPLLILCLCFNSSRLNRPGNDSLILVSCSFDSCTCGFVSFFFLLQHRQQAATKHRTTKGERRIKMNAAIAIFIAANGSRVCSKVESIDCQ